MLHGRWGTFGKVGIENLDPVSRKACPKSRSFRRGGISRNAFPSIPGRLYIYICVCVKFSVRHTIWFFHFFESHAEHFVQSEWRLEFASIAATERPSWNDKIWCVQENDAVLIVGWCYPLSQNLLQTKVLSVQNFWVLTVGRPNFGKFLRF